MSKKTKITVTNTNTGESIQIGEYELDFAYSRLKQAFDWKIPVELFKGEIFHENRNLPLEDYAKQISWILRAKS